MTRVSRRELLSQAAVVAPLAVVGGGSALALGAAPPSLGATSEDIVAMYETLTPDGRADFLAVSKIISKYDLRWQSFESIGAMLERMTAHAASFVDPHIEWERTFREGRAEMQSAAERWNKIRAARKPTTAEDDELETAADAGNDKAWAAAVAASETPATTIAGAIAQIRIWADMSEEDGRPDWTEPWDFRAYQLGLATIERLA